jgi:hypothetical protein
MKNLAPGIYRKRLLVEGFYTVEVKKEDVESFLLGSAKHLGLKAYGNPVVFTPQGGMGRDENSGFDGFLPLIDSGISVYVWSKQQFLSVLFYTCADFSSTEAVAYTRNVMGINGETASMEF